jgi:peptide/nickel transport system ATP-binding protein
MPLLSVDGLATSYATARGVIRAVDRVSLDIACGETLAVVGESGCGKSTLGKSILRLVPVDSGRLVFDGVDIAKLSGRRLQPYRRRMQMVFQDASAALNPRQTAATLLETPLAVHGVRPRAERRDRAREIAERVGLSRESLSRYPHEFSGGQKQRIGIARALILQPELVVCDEPVSALDASIQAQILNLLVEIKDAFGLSYLFVSHDLSVVHYIADRIAVMYLGRIVETAPHQSLWASPRHPYTRGLIDAVPGQSGGRRREWVAPLPGDLPNPADPPRGCRFHPRCPHATARCRDEEPALRELAPGHWAACHLAAA